MNLDDLKKPFAPEQVHWRVGSTNRDKTKGLALCYIDARDVMDRLDEVCGPDGWQSRFEAVAGRVVCSIGIDVDEQDYFVWKSDGAGDTDVEGEKGGLSDAFKRAAVHWGIGRYLYRIDSPWVAIEPAGKSFKIAASEHGKLRATLEPRTAPKNGRDRAGLYDGQPAPAPAPAASAGKETAPVNSAKLSEFRAKLAATESLEQTEKLGAWLSEHGTRLFGPFHPELSAELANKQDQIKAQLG